LGYAVNDNLESLKEQLRPPEYVLDGLAVKGQITLISAPPNGGKTLLTIYMLISAIKKGLIQGKDVIYINADDGFNGAAEKASILDKYGIQALIIGHNDSFWIRLKNLPT
jgi:RecA-family ATPase